MCLEEEKRGVVEDGRARESGKEGRVGLVPVACSQSHPFLRCGSGRRRSDGGARALSNEMASNIVVVVRGICVGRIGRGW